MSGAPRQGLPTTDSAPERQFRVARPIASGDVVSSSMPAGASTLGADGQPAVGALGVMVDNVLGCAVMMHGSTDH
jgi:hypothetical protein